MFMGISINLQKVISNFGIQKLFLAKKKILRKLANQQARKEAFAYYVTLWCDSAL